MFGTQAEKRLKLLDFEANLLKAVKQTPSLSNPASDRHFLQELAELGRAYAVLDPVQEGASGQEEGTIFLDSLWRLQDVEQGASKLEDFHEEFYYYNNMINLFEFETDLLNLCRRQVDLQMQMDEYSFTSEVFEFGGDYSGFRSLESLPEVNEEPYRFLTLLKQSQENPARDIPGAMEDIVRNAASKRAWAACLGVFGVELAFRVVAVATFCTPPVDNVLPCLAALTAFGIVLQNFVRCLEEFSDGDPSHQVSPNDPDLVKLKQLIQYIESWTNQRMASLGM